MIVGIGNDLSDISRVAAVLEKYGDRFTPPQSLIAKAADGETYE